MSHLPRSIGAAGPIAVLLVIGLNLAWLALLAFVVVKVVQCAS